MLSRLVLSRRILLARPRVAMSYPALPVAARNESTSSASKPGIGLPAPGEGTPTKLNVSGEGSTVKLSGIGPIVVNVDGTVSRINNWSEMTEFERETTVRMVGKRNKIRLENLKKAKEAAESTSTDQSQ